MTGCIWLWTAALGATLGHCDALVWVFPTRIGGGRSRSLGHRLIGTFMCCGDFVGVAAEPGSSGRRRKPSWPRRLSP